MQSNSPGHWTSTKLKSRSSLRSMRSVEITHSQYLSLTSFTKQSEHLSGMLKGSIIPGTKASTGYMDTV